MKDVKEYFNKNNKQDLYAKAVTNYKFNGKPCYLVLAKRNDGKEMMDPLFLIPSNMSGIAPYSPPAEQMREVTMHFKLSDIL